MRRTVCAYVMAGLVVTLLLLTALPWMASDSTEGFQGTHLQLSMYGGGQADLRPAWFDLPLLAPLVLLLTTALVVSARALARRPTGRLETVAVALAFTMFVGLSGLLRGVFDSQDSYEPDPAGYLAAATLAALAGSVTVARHLSRGETAVEPRLGPASPSTHTLLSRGGVVLLVAGVLPAWGKMTSVAAFAEALAGPLQPGTTSSAQPWGLASFWFPTWGISLGLIGLSAVALGVWGRLTGRIERRALAVLAAAAGAFVAMVLIGLSSTPGPEGVFVAGWGQPVAAGAALSISIVSVCLIGAGMRATGPEDSGSYPRPRSRLEQEEG